MLRQSHGDGKGGSAWLAVRLLDQATARQAARITTARQAPSPSVLCTISAADVPDQMQLQDSREPACADEQQPGPYL